MTITTAETASGRIPPPTSTHVGEVISVTGKYTLTSAAEFGVNDDEIYLGILPADHVMIDGILDVDDIDDASSLVLDIGIKDLIQTDSDTSNQDAFLDGVTTGQAGGVARFAEQAGFDIAPVAYDRYIVAKAETSAGTDKTGEIRVHFSYRTRTHSERI